MPGPLAHLKVVEMAGLGPCPLAGQLLADLGAQVTVIDRQSKKLDVTDINRRGKRSIAPNLKSPLGKDVVERLVCDSDVLIEGFRPGVMERLGLGPVECEALNPRLIYGRLTGWGQDGPLSNTAGHDINYLAITGALACIGTKDSGPIPPINLAADYGGGTLFLVFGVLSALYERAQSGKGQVIDAAMIDGVPAMMGLMHQWHAQGAWTTTRQDNLLDGAAPFYRCYQTKDASFMSVGALEPQFFKELIRLLEFPDSMAVEQNNRDFWPKHIQQFSTAFLTRTQEEWVAHFRGSDACVAPVLTFDNAQFHSHNAHRKIFQTHEGVQQAAPAPRFSRSSVDAIAPVSACGQHTQFVLSELGLTADDMRKLTESGALT